MKPLADRERKLVAILILVAMLVLAYLLVIGPILSGFAERAAQRDMLALQYTANQRQIAAIPRLLRQAEKQKADLHDFVLAAPSPAAGSAMLQERLQKTAETVGGEIRSLDDSSGDDGLARAKGVVRVTLDQLVRLLADLQNQTPHVTIESLTIAADRALISGHLEQMDVTLELSVPLARPAAR